MGLLIAACFTPVILFGVALAIGGYTISEKDMDGY